MDSEDCLNCSYYKFVEAHVRYSFYTLMEDYDFEINEDFCAIRKKRPQGKCSKQDL